MICIEELVERYTKFFGSLFEETDVLKWITDSRSDIYSEQYYYSSSTMKFRSLSFTFELVSETYPYMVEKKDVCPIQMYNPANHHPTGFDIINLYSPYCRSRHDLKFIIRGSTKNIAILDTIKKDSTTYELEELIFNTILTCSDEIKSDYIIHNFVMSYVLVTKYLSIVPMRYTLSIRGLPISLMEKLYYEN